MVFKVIDATGLKIGSFVILEGEVFQIKSMEISKTGKHGHSKCRIEAVAVIGEKKKVMVVPGHERFEIPMIEKRKAQVLSILNNKANLMDAENFENFELEIPEDLKEQVKEGITLEYWDMEGRKIIKRAL